MRFLAYLLLAIVIAVAGGIGSAWLMVSNGRVFGALHAREWTAWPQAGTLDADPYSRAMMVRTGEIPLGPSEGVAFQAPRDSSGQALTGRCDYAVVGETPPARLWSLSVIDAAGAIASNPFGRTHFQSREVLRMPDGRFEIVLSARARPGNWLPIEAKDGLTLVMRLYDTPITVGGAIGEITMPRIERRGCR